MLKGMLGGGSEDAVSRVGKITEEEVRGWDPGLLWTARLWEKDPSSSVVSGKKKETGPGV